MHPEHQYLGLLAELLEKGDKRIDRTGVGTRALFGRTLRFDLGDDRVPVLTTKKVLWRQGLVEMLWFLRGETQIRSLLEQGVGIWSDWPHRRYVQETGEDIDLKAFEARVLGDDDFARRWGDLGPVYGRQWRAWETRDGGTIDQMAKALEAIRHNPASRRIIVEGWNVGQLEQMALPPCHKTYQFWVSSAGKLSLAMQQRSADVFLGLPWNLWESALLTRIMAQQAGLEPGELVWFGADVHLYLNHSQQALIQLERQPRPFPRLTILRKADSFDGYRPEDFRLEGYDPHPAIRAPVAV